MAAGFVAQQSQVDLIVSGTSVTVPNNPHAKLMYYLKSVFSCVPDLEELAALLDYTEYYKLTTNEKEMIMQLAKELNPGIVNNVIFHRVESLPGGKYNKFVTVESATEVVVAAASSDGAVMLGGKKVEARHFMFYINRWMDQYYWEPLADIDRQRRALLVAPVSPKPQPIVRYTPNPANQVQRSAPAQPVYNPQPRPTNPAPVIIVHAPAAPTGPRRATAEEIEARRKCCIAVISTVATLIIVAAIIVLPIFFHQSSSSSG